METTLTRSTKGTLAKQQPIHKDAINTETCPIATLIKEFSLVISMVYAARAVVNDFETDLFISANSALNVATELLEANLNRINERLFDSVDEFMDGVHAAAGIVYVTSTAIMDDELSEFQTEACHASALLDEAHNKMVEFEGNIDSARSSRAGQHQAGTTTQ